MNAENNGNNLGAEDSDGVLADAVHDGDNTLNVSLVFTMCGAAETLVVVHRQNIGPKMEAYDFWAKLDLGLGGGKSRFYDLVMWIFHAQAENDVAQNRLYTSQVASDLDKLEMLEKKLIKSRELQVLLTTSEYSSFTVRPGTLMSFDENWSSKLFHHKGSEQNVKQCRVLYHDIALKKVA